MIQRRNPMRMCALACAAVIVAAPASAQEVSPGIELLPAGRDPATGKRKIQYASFRGTKGHKTAVALNAALARTAGS
jgi:hypothetical protein